MTSPEAILDFWFEPRPVTKEEAGRAGQRWFAGGKSLDSEIVDKFAETLAAARRGELDAWSERAASCLALVILLDQFPRNVFRGSAEAFSSDARARALAEGAIERGFDEGMPVERRLFFALPFTHAEDLDAQRTGVAAAERLALIDDPLWNEFVRGSVDFFRKHLDVIARFGRFPHRNVTLRRESTEAERGYLAYLAHVGQWL